MILSLDYAVVPRYAAAWNYRITLFLRIRPEKVEQEMSGRRALLYRLEAETSSSAAD